MVRKNILTKICVFLVKQMVAPLGVKVKNSPIVAFFCGLNRVAPRWFAGKMSHKLAQKRRSCPLITWNCGLKSHRFEDQVRDYDQNLVSLRIIWKITTNFSQFEDHLEDHDSNLVSLRITPEYFGQFC